MRGLLECVGRRGDSKTFLSESSFNGDAGAWLVVCTGSGRQRVVHWCGQEDALMLFNTNKTSGRSVSERNGTSFTFTCIQDEPTSYIENMEEI